MACWDPLVHLIRERWEINVTVFSELFFIWRMINWNAQYFYNVHVCLNPGRDGHICCNKVDLFCIICLLSIPYQTESYTIICFMCYRMFKRKKSKENLTLFYEWRNRDGQDILWETRKANILLQTMLILGLGQNMYLSAKFSSNVESCAACP